MIGTVQQARRPAYRQIGTRAAFGGRLACLGRAFLPAMPVNVRMNEALGATIIPPDSAEAAAIWPGYSIRWQFWNQLRSIGSGLALMLAAAGLAGLARKAG